MMENVKQQFDSDHLVRNYLAPIFLFGGLLVIFYTTLMPFEFAFRLLAPQELLAAYEVLPNALFDFPRNILLFMPYGFGLTAVLDRRGWPRKRTVMAVLITGFLLTLTVESLQPFLPDRQPSVSDLVSNTLGALAGLGTYRIWQNRAEVRQEAARVLLTPRLVVSGVALYTILLLIVAHQLATGVRFSKWEPDFHLLLGNEQTGDRPWQGEVRELAIFGAALGVEEVRDLLGGSDARVPDHPSLLAYYPLHDGASQEDVSGQQPDLVWRFTAPARGDEHAWQLDETRWLETRVPPSGLSAVLEETSAMTVAFKVTSGSANQTGPARILTISEHAYLRNLTIGQEGAELVLRVRNHLSGDNGIAPEFRFPGIFASTDSQMLVVTFDGITLRVFSSELENPQAVELLPGAAFIGEVDPEVGPYWLIRASAMTNWRYHLLFYALFLLPPAILVSSPALKKWPAKTRLGLSLAIFLALPLLLEWVLVAPSGNQLRPVHVGAGILVVAVLAGVLAPAVRKVFSPWRTV